MTQQMMNLSKWKWLTEGELARFTGIKPRAVRLDVNAPDKIKMFIRYDDGEPVFLALVEGRDRIEFGVDGAFDLYIEGGECAFYTVDGSDWSVEKVDHRSFTRIMERRVRNPELEKLMHLQQVNLERRLAQQERDFEKRLERRLNVERDIRRRAEESGGDVIDAATASDDPSDGGTASDDASGKAGADAVGGDAANSNKQPDKPAAKAK